MGLAAIREFLDDSVWDAQKLERLTSFPVFASIPEFETKSKTLKTHRNRFVMGAVLLMFAAAFAATLKYLNLDILTFWSKWGH